MPERIPGDRRPSAAPSCSSPLQAAEPASAATGATPAGERAARPPGETDRFVTGRSPSPSPPPAASAASPEDATLRARERRRARRFGSRRAPERASAPPRDADGRLGVTFEFDTGGGKSLSDVKLKGSWNKETGRYDPLWGGGDAVPMYDDGTHGDRVAGDGIYTVRQKLVDDGSGRSFEWGVTVDGPAGDDRWAVTREGNLRLRLDETSRTESYALTTTHRMGVHKRGEDGVSFRVWLPNVEADSRVTVELRTAWGAPASFRDGRDRAKSIALVKDERTGVWSAELPSGWKQLEGKFYHYKSERPGKEPMLIKDPYSRHQQGQQRGVERVAIDEATGVERPWYWDAKDPRWARQTRRSGKSSKASGRTTCPRTAPSSWWRRRGCSEP